MQLNNMTILLMSLVASTVIAAPLTTRQSSVEGQACTDGDFDGTCRADGRCGLELPPNELSFQFIQGQCGISGNDASNDDDDDDDEDTANDANGNDDGGNNNESVEGQACTDGTFDGTCRADGRCGGNANDNANNADGEADADSSDDAASFEGQSCTDGDFDGVCLANGRCALQIPPNINSEEFVSGQCGQ
ncbi:hypothetical protein MGN70_006436 [Eutypa lata]|nr:hypothetical protein MGN70_006436 [Eutypa lata]